jgi:4-hydroxy 2-oxovalerate aldolase
MNLTNTTILDCTLRDGGYYNDWDFPAKVTEQYIIAISEAGVDVVEIGFRSLNNEGFKGVNAFASDDYISNLKIPAGLKVSVMINASEILKSETFETSLEKLFPLFAKDTSVDIVRVACHAEEFVKALPISQWLKNRGYFVGFNLMQVTGCSQEQVEAISLEASLFPVDVIYFADSLGSMTISNTTSIIKWFRKHWHGSIGIHAHDNMGMALSNTLCAMQNGATWLDSTITGMGRGPGNVRTEELIIELIDDRKKRVNLVPLISIIKSFFQPLKHKCGWGTNPYYYLAGKYNIHPSFIQEMLSDSRYKDEDILAVIEYLRKNKGDKFNSNSLDVARQFYSGDAKGSWSPKEVFISRDVLILGGGPGLTSHKEALEIFIKKTNPIVIALNAQINIDASIINFRVACHPVRLLADSEAYTELPQALIAPFSRLPKEIRLSFTDKKILDFGIALDTDSFDFFETYCVLPTPLVFAYALAIATSGEANQIFLAGFDGYGFDDPRDKELQKLLDLYQLHKKALSLTALTPTRFNVPIKSVYGL